MRSLGLKSDGSRNMYNCLGNDSDFKFRIQLPNGRYKTLALFEWKHQNITTISYNNTAGCSLRMGCDEADELGVPFFIGITYTKSEDTPESRNCTKPVISDRPVIYLLDGNKPAYDILTKLNHNLFCAADFIKLYYLLAGKPNLEPIENIKAKTCFKNGSGRTDIPNQILLNKNIDYASLRSYSATWVK